MIRAFASSFVVAAVLFSAWPAESHHSNVLYEVTKVVTITGTVKEFRWVNPHTWLYMTIDDGKGGKTEWKVEGRAPGILRRAGWKTTSLNPGDVVTVDMSPAKDGTHVGIIARVTKADGTILSNQPTFQ
jgi:translation initiation factor IF-1